jgi:hypothetical protein
VSSIEHNALKTFRPFFSDTHSTAFQSYLSNLIKTLSYFLQSTEEQKLIYSGQLLNDAVVLKDVLRQYDGQETHTVHLVFTPKSFKNSSFYNKTSTSGKMQSNTDAAGPSSNVPSTQGDAVDSPDGLR